MGLMLTVYCDDCGERVDRPPFDQLESALSARQHSHRKGWIHTARGKDFCPTCAVSHAREPLGRIDITPPPRRRSTA